MNVRRAGAADVAAIAGIWNHYIRDTEVMLAPGNTGRGQGWALMTAVLDHARAGGAHTIFAGISSANPGALAFHAALGFEPAAVLPEAGWKNGRWFDLHLMRYWF